MRNSMPESMQFAYIDSPGRERLEEKKLIKSYDRVMIIKERTFFMDTSGLTGSGFGR
jgi:hypothetical protein